MIKIPIDKKLDTFLKKIDRNFYDYLCLKKTRINGEDYIAFKDIERPDLFTFRGLERAYNVYLGRRIPDYKKFFMRVKKRIFIGEDNNKICRFYIDESITKTKNLLDLYLSNLSSSEFYSFFKYVIQKQANKKKFSFVEISSLSVDYIILISKIIFSFFVDENIKVTKIESNFNIENEVDELVTFDLHEISKFIGTDLSASEIFVGLKKFGHICRVIKNNLEIEPPFYRHGVKKQDILKDLISGISIDEDYFQRPNFDYQKGSLNKEISFIYEIKELLARVGYKEIYCSLLKKEGNHFIKTGEFNGFQTDPIDNMIEFEENIKTMSYPHKFFTVSPTYLSIADGSIGNFEKYLTYYENSQKSNINDIAYIIELICTTFNLKYQIKNSENENFEPGIYGIIEVENIKLGSIGQINSNITKKHKLIGIFNYCSINLTQLYKIILQGELSLLGGKKLSGSVKVSGSKNAFLFELYVAASLPVTTVFVNAPVELRDIRISIDILKQLGVEIQQDIANSRISVRGPLKNQNIFAEDIGKIRSSLLLIPIMACTFNKLSFPLDVGGCNIGERKIDQHLKLLKEAGNNYEIKEGILFNENNVNELEEITFDIVSTGATQAAMIMAILSDKKKIVINNAHLRPEIIDGIELIRMYGYKVKYSESDKQIIVYPTKVIKETVVFDVMGDLDESITYAIACAIAGGEIEILGFNPQYVVTELQVLEKIGLEIKRSKNSIVIKCPKKTLYKPFKITIGEYPHFASDRHPMMTALALYINGTSKIIDERFPDRVKYLDEFRKLGMSIKKSGNEIIIYGKEKKKLSNEISLTATDIRGGASCLLFALGQRVIVNIYNFEQISRGYEFIDLKLRNLGVDIFRTRFE